MKSIGDVQLILNFLPANELYATLVLIPFLRGIVDVKNCGQSLTTILFRFWQSVYQRFLLPLPRHILIQRFRNVIITQKNPTTALLETANLPNGAIALFLHYRSTCASIWHRMQLSMFRFKVKSSISQIPKI